MDFKGVYLISIESMWILIKFYIKFNGVYETFIMDLNRVLLIVMNILMTNSSIYIVIFNFFFFYHLKWLL